MKFYVPRGKPVEVPNSEVSYDTKLVKARNGRRKITMASAVHNGRKVYKIISNQKA